MLTFSGKKKKETDLHKKKSSDMANFGKIFDALGEKRASSANSLFETAATYVCGDMTTKEKCRLLTQGRIQKILMGG